MSTKFARLSSSTNGTENLMDDRTFRFYSVLVELKTSDIEMIFDMHFCRSRSNYNIKIKEFHHKKKAPESKVVIQKGRINKKY